MKPTPLRERRLNGRVPSLSPTLAKAGGLTKFVVNTLTDTFSSKPLSAKQIQFRARGGFTPSDLSYWN
jgi:hypothetical protein